MDTLDRYLLKDYLLYFFLVLTGLAILFLGIDFMSNIWGMKRPLGEVFQLYGYKLPGALQQFVPVACLMATLLLLANMSRQNEILALYISGIGTFRLVSTLVAVVATISTFTFVLFDSLVPLFNKREALFKMGKDFSEEQYLVHNRAGVWYRSGDLIYNVGRYLPDTNTLEDLRIYRVEEPFRVKEMLRAKRAQFKNEEWVLEDGFMLEYPNSETAGHFPQAKTFQTQTSGIMERPGDFKTLIVDDHMMRLKELRRYIDRNRSYGFDMTAQQVAYHERISLVFTPLILVLLGIPFAIKPLQSQSLIKSVGFCFVSVFLYLLIFRLAVSVGKGGHIPPVVAGWVTNVLFLGAATLRLVRR